MAITNTSFMFMSKNENCYLIFNNRHLSIKCSNLTVLFYALSDFIADALSYKFL